MTPCRNGVNNMSTRGKDIIFEETPNGCYIFQGENKILISHTKDFKLLIKSFKKALKVFSKPLKKS